MLKTIVKGCEPSKGSKYSACIDLYAANDTVIGAGETVLVPLGVKIDISEEWLSSQGIGIDDGVHDDGDAMDLFMKTHQLNLHIRSSMSAKHGFIIANGTGIIDLDYPDEIKICLHNPIDKNYIDDILAKNKNSKYYGQVVIQKGQPIAQISLVEHKSYLFDVESKDERTGGFGSTDEHKS